MNTTLVLMRNMQDNGDIDRNVVDKATQKFRRSVSIFTARIRRMGKVMFSQVCVRPHSGGNPVSGSFLGLWVQVLSQGVPQSQVGGITQYQVERVPQSQVGCTPGLGYPPSWTGLGYPPVPDRTRIHPPDQDWGTLPARWDWGIPPSQDRAGVPPPPSQDWSGVPSLPRTAERVLTTRRVVCLLRSRRRTFLFLLHSWNWPIY